MTENEYLGYLAHTRIYTHIPRDALQIQIEGCELEPMQTTFSAKDPLEMQI